MADAHQHGCGCCLRTRPSFYESSSARVEASIEVDFMGLPVKFHNVHYYRISGRYTFAGDLFIARGAVYFFPEVDLAEQRRRSMEYAPHQFGLIVFAIVYLVQRLSSYVSKNGLWEEDISDEQFQK